MTKVTIGIATAMLGVLASTGIASAQPHLEANRTYSAFRGELKGAGASLRLYTDPGPGDAKSGRMGLYCGHRLTLVSPTFQILPSKATGFSKEINGPDRFSSQFPIRALGIFDFAGKVVQRGGRGPTPLLNLTIGTIPPCGDVRTLVKNWELLNKRKDNTTVSEINAGILAAMTLPLQCPTTAEMGKPVTVVGQLKPDSGGTTITISRQSSANPPPPVGPVGVQTFSTGVFNHTFSPGVSAGPSYTETVTATFAGDPFRLPASGTCRIMVVPAGLGP